MAENDKQVDFDLGNPDLDKTVSLLRCNKHGLTYMQGEGCPECAKEKNQSGEQKTDQG